MKQPKKPAAVNSPEDIAVRSVTAVGAVFPYTSCLAWLQVSKSLLASAMKQLKRPAALSSPEGNAEMPDTIYGLM